MAPRAGPARHVPSVFTVQWHVGDVVRKLRDSVGWTQTDLAGTAGVSVQIINRLEKAHTHRPRRTTLDRLGAPFSLGAQELLDLVPTAPHTTVRMRPVDR